VSEWISVCPAAALGPGRVVTADVAGVAVVVWRTASGALAAMPRWCPHLDRDLAEGVVTGDELVCTGHGWSFDSCGHAFKRNELGRVDPKDDVETYEVREVDGTIVVRAPRTR
jgi:hypothetical protein